MPSNTPVSKTKITYLKKWAGKKQTKVLAKELGATESAVRQWACKHKISLKLVRAVPDAHITDRDVELMRMLNDEGVKPKDIAEKFEVDIKYVKQILGFKKRAFINPLDVMTERELGRC